MRKRASNFWKVRISIVTFTLKKSFTARRSRKLYDTQLQNTSAVHSFLSPLPLVRQSLTPCLGGDQLLSVR
jgi:hypothetical protein